jgi:hypothetical protein
MRPCPGPHGRWAHASTAPDAKTTILDYVFLNGARVRIRHGPIWAHVSIAPDTKTTILDYVFSKWGTHAH